MAYLPEGYTRTEWNALTPEQQNATAAQIRAGRQPVRTLKQQPSTTTDNPLIADMKRRFEPTGQTNSINQQAMQRMNQPPATPTDSLSADMRRRFPDKGRPPASRVLPPLKT